MQELTKNVSIMIVAKMAELTGLKAKKKIDQGSCFIAYITNCSETYQ